MSDYKPANLKLNLSQAKKLLSGSSVRLKASEIGVGDDIVYLHKVQHRLLTAAKRQKKGYMLELSPGEILTTVEHDMSGNGIFSSIWKGLKSGYNWVKKNVIDTDIYQSAIKPLVKTGVNTLANTVKTIIPGDIDDKLIDKGVAYVGDKTKAFGLKKEIPGTSHQGSSKKVEGIHNRVIVHDPKIDVPPTKVVRRKRISRNSNVLVGGSFVLN
jgi:hypothetical protein